MYFKYLIQLLVFQLIYTTVQVTDMMIANSACLVITIRPFNQRHNVRRRGVIDDVDLLSVKDSADDDEICEHLPTAAKKPPPERDVTSGKKAPPGVPVADWVVVT